MNILEKFLGLIQEFSEKYNERFRIISGEYLEVELRKIETNFEGFRGNFDQIFIQI